MRRLSGLDRRSLGGALLGAAVLAAPASRPALAHDGPHRRLVAIDRFAFRPDRLEIVVGDTVEWRNDDLAPHTATADLDAADLDAGDLDGWGTGEIAHGAVSAVRFEAVGRHPYHCAYHPRMTGEIVVLAADHAA